MKSRNLRLHRMPADRGIGFLLVAMLSLAVLGCGNDLPKVKGKVTLDGEPLPNAFIEFVPTGGTGSVSYGKTDSEGNYELSFSRDEKGASPGESKVKITTADVEVDDSGNEVHLKEKVPARYNSQTELIRTVEPGDNQFDFELTSEGKTDKAVERVAS